MKHLNFPSAKSIVVSGDIHGDFNQLIFKMCVQYQMRDTLLIVAGDCGFGFYNRSYYEDMAKRNSKRLSEANNWIVFVRGNHDNPAYFDGHIFNHRRLMAIPDYTIIQACRHTILCVGGGISIDRRYRIDKWEAEQKFISSTTRLFSKGEICNMSPLRTTPSGIRLRRLPTLASPKSAFGPPAQVLPSTSTSATQLPNRLSGLPADMATRLIPSTGLTSLSTPSLYGLTAIKAAESGTASRARVTSNRCAETYLTLYRCAIVTNGNNMKYKQIIKQFFIPTD